MAEISACRKFADLLRVNFTSEYNLELTNLKTVMSRLIAKKYGMLIFYLHHSEDPFSKDFCSFLQTPDIAKAFQQDHLILYCWDIENAEHHPELIDKFANYFGYETVEYFIENRSVAFSIISWDEKPIIIHTINNPDSLLLLKNLLLDEPLEEEHTPLSFQQSMAKYLGFDDYISYEKDDHDELKRNIRYALYGPPTIDNQLEILSEEDKKAIEKNKGIQNNKVDKIYNLILKENDMYCKWNGRIVIKIIYICAVTLPKDKAKMAEKCAKENKKYNPDSDFVPYSVFILRKCKHRYDPHKACRIIIDIEGRVYKSWDAYLQNNKLPPCEIFYPKDGRYRDDDNTEYLTKLSPACDPLTKVANVMDVTTGVGSVLAGGVSLATTSTVVLGAIPVLAAAAPVALPIAATVGIGSGIYAVGRSIHNLVDRKMHKQEMDLSVSDCRTAYLNIAGGILNVGMFGAMRTVAFLAGRGISLGQGTRYVLYGLNGINITVGGLGIGNAVYQAYNSEERSALLYAQLGASFLFFAHSVYNFRSITNIIEESQAQNLNEIEISLRSNRHRRTFNKLLKESIRTQGETQGKASVISSIRKMDNVDDVMAVLTRSNKMLHKQGIRFSAVGDQIMLNGKPIDMMNFGSMSKTSQVSFLKTFPPIPENITPMVQTTITNDVEIWIQDIEVLKTFVQCRDVEQVVDQILCGFKKEVRDHILDITKRFLKKVDPRVINALATSTANYFNTLMKWICNELISNDTFKVHLNRSSGQVNLTSVEIDAIVNNLEQSFLSSYTNYEYDTALRDIRRERRRMSNVPKREKLCECCGGYYYTVLVPNL